MEKAVPEALIEGVKEVMVGASGLPTVNGLLLVAEPDGEVTATSPVVAPDGTLVTIRVEVEEMTVAAVPLKVTVFWLAVAIKHVPLIVTSVPVEPPPGVKPMIEICDEFWREMDCRLPT